ncbi:hypothetical protein, partial [Acinetobacter baumannii]|uniref:hypothetical protein n=1 Tax=Acinetobacter baumannii TaxID=470 RepID=UPI001C0675B9
VSLCTSLVNTLSPKWVSNFIKPLHQISTLIEMYFRILKKYSGEVHHILCNIQDDLDDRAYLEWMHPKSLLKNK